MAGEGHGHDKKPALNLLPGAGIYQLGTGAKVHLGSFTGGKLELDHSLGGFIHTEAANESID